MQQQQPPRYGGIPYALPKRTTHGQPPRSAERAVGQHPAGQTRLFSSVPIEPSCFSQNAEVDISLLPEFEETLRLIHSVYSLYVWALRANVVGALGYFFFAGGPIGILFLALVQLFLFTPCAFCLWFGHVYKAFRDNSSFHFIMFLWILFLHTLFCMVQMIGLSYAVGWSNTIGAFSGGHLFVAILMVFPTLAFTLTFFGMLSCFFDALRFYWKSKFSLYKAVKQFWANKNKNDANTEIGARAAVAHLVKQMALQLKSVNVNFDKPEDVYKKYSIRREFTLYVTSTKVTSNVWVEGKTWELVCHQLPSNNMPSSTTATAESTYHKLELQMSMSSAAQNDALVAEIIFWHWDHMKQVVLERGVHKFSNNNNDGSNSPNTFTGDAIADNSLSALKSFSISVNVNSGIFASADNKCNCLVRLLDPLMPKALAEPEIDPLDTVTLRTEADPAFGTEMAFTVPRGHLMAMSPVFQRMFATKMTETASGQVDVKETTAEELGDFLDAISAKQINPNPYNVRALLRLADRYDVQSLRDRCELHLINCVEIPLIERLLCLQQCQMAKLKNFILMILGGTNLMAFLNANKEQLGNIDKELIIELITRC